MKSLVSGVLVRVGSLSSEGKFLRACSRVSWFIFIDRGKEVGSCLTYCLISSNREKLIKCFLITFSCPPKFPGLIRKSIYRWHIPKNLVPSVRAHGEPGPKCPGSIRKSYYRVYLPKNLVPSVLVRLGSRSTEFTFLRTWS